MRIPIHREPTHPGEMLREEFLLPMGNYGRLLIIAVGYHRQYWIH